MHQENDSLDQHPTSIIYSFGSNLSDFRSHLDKSRRSKSHLSLSNFFVYGERIVSNNNRDRNQSYIGKGGGGDLGLRSVVFVARQTQLFRRIQKTGSPTFRGSRAQQAARCNWNTTLQWSCPISCKLIKDHSQRPGAVRHWN
jgi:hypothetical protein